MKTLRDTQYTDDDIARRMREIIAEALALDPSSITLSDNSNLLDFGMDSTSAVEVFLLIERAFGVSIDGSELSTELLENYGELKTWLQEKLT